MNIKYFHSYIVIMFHAYIWMLEYFCCIRPVKDFRAVISVSQVTTTLAVISVDISCYVFSRM